jgi:hypothetical protein
MRDALGKKKDWLRGRATIIICNSGAWLPDDLLTSRRRPLGRHGEQLKSGSRKIATSHTRSA